MCACVRIRARGTIGMTALTWMAGAATVQQSSIYAMAGWAAVIG
eukprot:SAG31_NODE_5218_length_2669_cov_2.345136_3_plen_44_part_00